MLVAPWVRERSHVWGVRGDGCALRGQLGCGRSALSRACCCFALLRSPARQRPPAASCAERVPDAAHTRVSHFRSHHGCAFGRHGARRVRHAVRGVCPRLSVGGPLAPSTTAHWVGSAGQDLLIHATDSGSGVTEVKLQVDGRTVDSTRQSCPWGRCSLDYDSVAPYLSDGTHTVTAVARDAAGNTTTLPSWTIDVDQTPPVVAVSGTGFRNENQPASSGTLSLRVSAKDANRPKSGPRASGVVAITTYVDEDGLIGGPAASRSCPQGRARSARRG